MKEGLYVLVTRGTYYGLTRIGWLRREQGDEWEMVNCRSVLRTAYTADTVGLQKLAQCKGKVGNHKLGELSLDPEPVHRLQMVRPIPINREHWHHWEKEFPRPENWVDHE